jgi:hypothetical protein
MKKQLIELAKSLSEVTKVSWLRGDFEQWSDWAFKMKATINVVVPQLNSIAETLDEKDNDLHNKVESIVKNILVEKKYSIEDIKKAIELSKESLSVKEIIERL